MRRSSLLMLTCGVLALAMLALEVPAQQGQAPGAGGPPTTRPGGPPPGGFHLLPRFAMEKLNLTPDQMKQVADLEKETKAKLDKILTADQQKTLEEMRPPRRGNGDGPPNGPDGGGQGGGDHPPRPQPPAQ